MQPQPLTIWCNIQLSGAAGAALQNGLQGHRLVSASSIQASNLAGAGRDPLLADADIAFGQPNPQQALELPRLRWIHLTTAGYARYDRDDLKIALRERRGCLTNSSHVFDEPCAQHLLAMMLATARRLPESLDNQRGDYGWPSLPLRADSFLLTGQTALLVGFGAIARRLAELLAPFRMNLIGVRRSVRGDEPIKVVAMDEIDALLPLADHVINILPASRETTHYFNADRIGRMKSSAVFYNIGRGDTVDQAALRTALETRAIQGAYLDVTTPEPIAPDDPLWRTPHCRITPHTAGGYAGEFDRLVEHFLDNLRRFERNEALLNRVF